MLSLQNASKLGPLTGYSLGSSRHVYYYPAIFLNGRSDFMGFHDDMITLFIYIFSYT